LARPTVQQWALQRLLEVLDRDGDTLEVGCGSGGVVRELHARGFRMQCADVDRWHEEIEGVVHTRGADLSSKLPFDDGAFRSVIALEVLEHVTNPFNAVREMARILEPGGQLVLTLPNFWNVRARWRFLLRGSVNRSRVRDIVAQGNLREGRCPPHINTLPWPTLKFALVSFGLGVDEMLGYVRSPLRHAGGLPLAGAIWLATRLVPVRRRARFELDDTNRWSVLYASRHVLVRAHKLPGA